MGTTTLTGRKAMKHELEDAADRIQFTLSHIGQYGTKELAETLASIAQGLTDAAHPSYSVTITQAQES